MARFQRQFPAVAIVCGLLVAGIVACSGVAFADDKGVLPAGSKCQRPSAPEWPNLSPEVAYAVDRFAVTRPQLNKANAAAETARRLEALLADVTTTALRLSAPEAGWKIAVRWSAIGIAIGAAFVGGAVLF